MILESRKTTFILAMLILVLLVPVVGQLNSFAVGRSDSAKTAKEKNVDPDTDPDFIKQERDFSEKGKVSILFGGDMMFDRYIRQVVEMRGIDHVFGNLAEVIGGADLVVANLEGPITENESKSVGSEFGSRENYVFTFPKETAGDLFANNIAVVNIGNNHILNFGEDGLKQTRNFLKQAGVEYFGDPLEKDNNFSIKEVKGLKIAFVCFNQFSKDGREKSLEGIALAKGVVDSIVVYAHWGNEYEMQSDQKQRDLAHQFVDAGADLVIGSHPHVIQETETYKDKRIYYSLGNFVFDQYFKEETKKGLLVKVSIGEGGIESFEEIAIGMDASGKTSITKK